jgi:hypothetical protein
LVFSLWLAALSRGDANPTCLSPLDGFKPTLSLRSFGTERRRAPLTSCLILRNSAEVVRRHYIRLEQEGTKVDAMARLEQAYEQCSASVQ